MTLLLLLVPFSTLLPFSTFHQIATAAAPTGVIVPLYTYLGSTWDTVIAAKNAHPNVPIVVIANLEGPGPSQDPAFLTGIQKLQAAGIVVIGYVDTLYGARSSTIVKSEIDAWKGWYNVNGIFFDEMANWSGGESYYSSLNSYVKLKGMTITVGNPGIDTLPSYIGTVDNMMIYESAGLPSITSLQGWHTSYDKSNFSIIPFGVNTLDTSYATSASNYLGYIYITNDNLPNPWDSLPPYFGNLVAALDTGAIPPPSDTTLPSVSITSPATGATVSDLISISVSATDNVAVSKVQLFVDNVFNAEDTTNSYSFTFDTKTLSNGSHVLKATGIDTSNNAASSSITINVNNIILPPPPPQLNPIANWKFEDNALDSSGNGNNGILINGPTFVAGKIGKAVNFDGVDDYVSVSDTNSLTLGTQATFVAWVFPRAIDENYDSIISKWDGTDEDEYLVGFQTSGAISFAWHTTGCISSCGAQYGTGAYNDLTSTLQVTLNAWNHVAVTRDGTTLTFYLNGNNHIITNAFDTNPFRNGVVPLKVGAENSGLNNRHINGIIDEVAIWNRALSATEIQSLFADSLVPNPPTALTATAVSSSQVNLSWTAPTGTVTGYEIERAIGIGPFSVLILNTGTAATIYSDTGLVHSTTYTYRVSAINSVGTSSPSNIASATTFNVVPSSPTNLSATAGNAQISLSWTAPTDNGGSAITGYNIYRGTTSGGEGTTPVATVNGSILTYTDSGLTNGQTYYYKVKAVNSVGTSAASNEASATPVAPATVPDAPTVLTATAISSSQINLSWTAPANNGGSPVTGYKIERSTDGGATWSVRVANTGSTATTYSDTGLAHSTTYTYRVSAINSVGTSSPSNIASVTTFNVVSSPPTGLTATAISSSQINLSWTAPTDNGGSPVTGYKIERESPVGGVFSTIVANTGTTAVTYSDTGLAASTVYNYRVSAINSEGISSPSNEASATTFNLPPPPSDTTLPSVSITSPATGATVSDLISISVSATDNVAVSKVQLYVDNVFNAEDTTNAYSFTLDTKTLSNGSHVLKATGIDTSNNAASSSITVNINNTTPPNPPPTPLPRLDLIANWKFKNNTLDSSGNGNNGILINGATFVAGKIGKAVNLDGVDDYVSVNDGNTLTPGTQATFMAWVFPRAIDEDYDGVISKWDGTDEDEYLVGLQTSRAISFAWHTTGCISSCEAQYGTGAYNDVVSTIKVKLNTWNFIAVARDGTTLTFYNATHSQTFSNAFDSNPFRNGVVPLKVGAENSGLNNRHINGIIDEVAIWNRALSATEIQLIAYSQQ